MQNFWPKLRLLIENSEIYLLFSFIKSLKNSSFFLEILCLKFFLQNWVSFFLLFCLFVYVLEIWHNSETFKITSFCFWKNLIFKACFRETFYMLEKRFLISTSPSISDVHEWNETVIIGIWINWRITDYYFDSLSLEFLKKNLKIEILLN